MITTEEYERETYRQTEIERRKERGERKRKVR